MRRSLLPSVFGNDKNETFSSLQKEIDRVFDEFKGMMPRFESANFPFSNGNIATKINVSETDNAVEITAELPGVSEKDVDISVSSNVITLKGERKVEKEERDKGGYRHIERRYGTFQRSFSVPGGFDGNKIQARYENGVLHLTLPKREEKKPKQIDVKVN